jgi:predicted HTH transcriptional regulator
MFGQDQPSQLQEQILALYDRNPDMSVAQIANRADCSQSYVRETINDYRGNPLGF